MLKLAALASLVSLFIFLLHGCSDANANVSTTSRRGCVISAAPTTQIVVVDPVVTDQVATPITVVAPATKSIPTPTKVVTKKKVTKKVPESGLYEVSGYTSEVGQTDSRPCEAADGSNICERKLKGELLCAAPRDVRLGTRVKIAGLGTCTVVDYMNERYTGTKVFDWYFGKDADPPKGHEKDLKYLPKLRKALGIGREMRTVTVVTH